MSAKHYFVFLYIIGAIVSGLHGVNSYIRDAEPHDGVQVIQIVIGGLAALLFSAGAWPLYWLAMYHKTSAM